MDRTTAVEKAFSKAIDSYDNHASLQREIAYELFNRFAPYPTKGNWLEIGSGTGFLTRILLKSCPQSLFANDISQKMLDRLPEVPNLMRLQADGEITDFFGNFSLIASSFALQWFKNPGLGLQKLAEKLSREGKMIVSLPLNPSFKEWESFVLEKGMPFTLNPLLDPEDVVKHLNPHQYKVNFSTHYYPLSFSTPVAFLNWFKHLGANVGLSGRRMSVSFLKELTNNKEPFNTGITVGFLEVEYV